MKITKHLFGILAFILFSSCVQESHPKEINVKLDMTAQEHRRKVGIRGEFPLSWEETTYLEDKENNGIYEGTFKIYTAGSAIEFKFVNSDDQFELKDQGNRILNFDYKPETIIIEAVFDKPNTKVTRQ